MGKYIVDIHGDIEGDYEIVGKYEPCDDCVSRQAVLDGLASIAKGKAESDQQKSLMGRTMFFVENLPSVTSQEPKADILDKIRAEMAELIEWHDCPIELDGGNDAWYCEAVNSCIAIIDKYRKEQE